MYIQYEYLDNQENEIRIDNNLRLILITPVKYQLILKPPNQLSHIKQYQSITTHILSANQLKSIIVLIGYIIDKMFQ